jgi:nanoRNase/pAp phosphatase (c-di-AMP/oligoRNAs hydrolase)
LRKDGLPTLRSVAAGDASQLVRGLRDVLERAARASSSQRVLILTHKSPDPDALGAAAGVQRLIEGAFGLEAEVATTGRIFRAENLAMVRELALYHADHTELDLTRFCGAVVVDSQPGFGHTIVPEGIDLLAVFDHHLSPDAGKEISIPHRDVRTEVGATSSLVYEYLRDANVEIDEKTATALFCGVRYDTGDLAHNVSPLDEEAYFELMRRADRQKLARIQRPRLPQDYYRELHRSLRMARRYGPAVVALLGSVKNPESVAEMADFFLRMEGSLWSFMGGAFEDQYYVSLRTRFGTSDAYGLLGQLLGDEGSFGGHGSVAGGRVPLELGDNLAVRRLERRLRGRVLQIIDPNNTLDEESRLGKTLT